MDDATPKPAAWQPPKPYAATPSFDGLTPADFKGLDDPPIALAPHDFKEVMQRMGSVDVRELARRVSGNIGMDGFAVFDNTSFVQFYPTSSPGVGIRLNAFEHIRDTCRRLRDAEGQAVQVYCGEAGLYVDTAIVLVALGQLPPLISKVEPTVSQFAPLVLQAERYRGLAPSDLLKTFIAGGSAVERT